MQPPLAIENIEDMRLREGIDDVELREAIGRLKVGDSVRLTIRAGSETTGGETLPVRITSIEGPSLRGNLARKPSTAGLARLTVGSLIAFTTSQVHSVIPGAYRVSQRPQRRVARQ